MFNPQPDAVFVDGLDFFTSALNRLGVSDWERPSPCEGWRALDVLGHVGAAMEFGTLLRDALADSDHLAVVAQVEHQVAGLSRKVGFDQPPGGGDGR